MHQESFIVARDASRDGQPALGQDLVGCAMHQRLLAAYGKLHRDPAHA